MEKDKNDIELVVLKYFIRTIKDNGIYIYFRRGVKNNGFIDHIITRKIGRVANTPFSSCMSYKDVVDTLSRITTEMTGKKAGEIDKYEHVTMTINHLLHFFLETHGISMDRLCRYGEEIYNLSCNRLFGDALEDLQEHEENIETMKSVEQVKAKLFQDYVNAMTYNKLPRSMTFDDFLKRKRSVLDRFDKGIDLETTGVSGQRLGRVPGETLENMVRQMEYVPWTETPIETDIGRADLEYPF